MSLLSKLRKDFPDITLKPGKVFYWSPKDKTVYYDNRKSGELASWSLLHEISHGLLGHKTYDSDFELLQLEVAAWEKANQVSATYNIPIDENHIQDCLDTYRDWLHARSKCPTCTARGIQVSPKQYECSQCDSKWQVSSARFCRPYRMKIKTAR